MPQWPQRLGQREPFDIMSLAARAEEQASAHPGASRLPSPNADEALSYRINRLGMACAVLHLGAHPDDEEGGMIAYLTHRIGARVVYWSATRGEGGQNRRGAETSDALGIVRTWESLDARGFDGGEILFGPFRDFGFSKSGEQTLSYWGRDDLVREIVRAIRTVQPAIVVCRWNGDAGDGHGHHQAVGSVAAEAFSAAADAGRYPDLAEQGLVPWQARTMYRSVRGDWQPGEPGESGRRIEDYERAGYVRLDAGLYDPVAGLTYQEQATSSLNCHVSQGMSFVPAAGPYVYYYRLDPCSGSAAPFSNSFFDGFTPTLAGLADYPGDGSQDLRAALDAVQDAAQAAADVFRPSNPIAAGRALAGGLSVLAGLRRLVDPATALGRYVERVIRDFESVAASCLGLRAEFFVARPHLTRGSRVPATLRVWKGGPDRVTIVRHDVRAPADWGCVSRPAGQESLVDSTEDAASGDLLLAATYELEVPPSEPPSTPYWLQEPSTPHRYEWPRAGALGQPFDAPLLDATIVVDLGVCLLDLRVEAIYRDGTLGGFRDLPISVLPSIEVAPRRRREIFPAARTDRRIRLEAIVRCIAEAGARATIALAAPEPFLVQPAGIELHFSYVGEAGLVHFDVDVPADLPEGVYEFRFQHGDGSVAVESQPVRLGPKGSIGPCEEATCTREFFRAEPAVIGLHVVDASFVPAKKVGYVPGLKEDIVPSLSRFDLDVTMLGDEELAFVDLHSFETIVIGPNAYQTRLELRNMRGAMLDYVAKGGVLIVQYQGYGYSQDCAPYPFSYAHPHDRVTMPDAPVEIVEPDHPVFSFPNEIGPRDFADWVGDRGLYFFGDWDRRYTPLLASQDTGETPRRGGFLVAPYARGVFVYLAYSLFRQIPAGIPGAVRLFANLLGLAEARIRQRMDFLRSVDLLASLSGEQLHEVARITHERRIEAGAYLARETEPGHELFIVSDGTIEIVKRISSVDRVIRTAERGDAIGEFAMLANMTRSASLRAATDATVLVLPAQAFKDLLRGFPDLSLRVMEMLVRKVIAQGAPGIATER